jgi:hypothetical protein
MKEGFFWEGVGESSSSVDFIQKHASKGWVPTISLEGDFNLFALYI